MLGLLNDELARNISEAAFYPMTQKVAITTDSNNPKLSFFSVQFSCFN